MAKRIRKFLVTIEEVDSEVDDFGIEHQEPQPLQHRGGWLASQTAKARREKAVAERRRRVAERKAAEKRAAEQESQ